jgi:diacylglycerol kinase (ATP)
VDPVPGLVVALVVVLVAALAVSVVAVLVARRRAAAADLEGALPVSEPEDRPLAAVVANPTKVEPGTREVITELCAELGWAEPLWIETTVEDPGIGQAKEAVARGADVVMAAGGDGTVRSVAESLAGTRVALGLLPAGTGNLLARTLGTPLDLPAAARVALTGDDRAIDIGRVRVQGVDPDGHDMDDAEHVFLVMAGTGFDADVMANTPEALKGRVGPFAYVVSGLRAMRGRRTRVVLTIDEGEPMRRRSRTVLVGNSGTLLGGLVLMPDAIVDDGILDVVNLAPKGIPGWVAVAARVASRRRRGHSRVEHWTGRSVVIRADEPQASQIDGDPIGDVTEMDVRVDPGALVVRVPERSDDERSPDDPTPATPPAPGTRPGRRGA